MRDPIQFSIPKHWTPAQAEAVQDFLTQLADAVFRAYEQPLVARARREALRLPLDDGHEPVRELDLPDDEDPIPF